MEINGLPLHPLVVHAVVVLAPLAAVTALAYAFVARWRWLLRWPMVALAAVASVASFAAVLSGESLLDQFPALGPLVADHMRHGERLRNLSLGFVAVTLLASWSLGGPSALASGRGARESRGALGIATVVLVAVAALGMLVLTFLTGDSGARAVWGG